MSEDNFDLGGLGIPINSDMLKKILGVGGNDPVNSPNPMRYPRHAKIEDGDILMALARYERIKEQEDAASRAVNELKHEAAIAMSKIYGMINDKYHEVTLRGDLEAGGSGLRKWQRDYYIVGYDVHNEKPDA